VNLSVPGATARQREITPTLSSEKLETLCTEMRSFLQVEDRRYGFKTYYKVWLGRDGVAYLAKVLGSKRAAVAVADQMIAHGLLNHVVGEHCIMTDRDLFYRFTEDEKSLALQAVSTVESENKKLSVDMQDNTVIPVLSREKLLSLCAEMQKSIVVKDRRYHFKTYRKCWLGCDGVEYLASILGSKRTATAVGNQMIAEGLFRHVVGEHSMADEALFYRFKEDVQSFF
jgi:hypothetical protein